MQMYTSMHRDRFAVETVRPLALLCTLGSSMQTTTVLRRQLWQYVGQPVFHSGRALAVTAAGPAVGNGWGII